MAERPQRQKDEIRLHTALPKDHPSTMETRRLMKEVDEVGVEGTNYTLKGCIAQRQYKKYNGNTLVASMKIFN